MPTPLRNLRVSDREWLEIRNAAQAKGVSSSDFLRRAALGLARGELEPSRRASTESVARERHAGGKLHKCGAFVRSGQLRCQNCGEAA